MEAVPLDAPLTYPGAGPDGAAALLTGGALNRLQPSPGPVAGWAVDNGRAEVVSEVLAGLGAPPMRQRHPVLAVGSNAAPAQLWRKFASVERLAVPMTLARVPGIQAGLSAHVSRPGYIPAVPVKAPGALSELWITWLDPAELAILDATEPNYERVRLGDGYPAELVDSGRVIAGCWIYAGRHGYLVDPAGRPRRLRPQPEVIAELLRETPGLAGLAGSTPEEWLRRTRDPGVRDQIRECFRSAGVTRTLALG
jgi:hypothetical protein